MIFLAKPNSSSIEAKDAINILKTHWLVSEQSIKYYLININNLIKVFNNCQVITLIHKILQTHSSDGCLYWFDIKSIIEKLIPL